MPGDIRVPSDRQAREIHGGPKRSFNSCDGGRRSPDHAQDPAPIAWRGRDQRYYRGKPWRRGPVHGEKPPCGRPGHHHLRSAHGPDDDVRPHKDQPYYHLLAENEDTEYVAYVSEQNLLADDTGTPLRHPQIEELFVKDESGQYRARFLQEH